MLNMNCNDSTSARPSIDVDSKKMKYAVDAKPVRSSSPTSSHGSSSSLGDVANTSNHDDSNNNDEAFDVATAVPAFAAKPSPDSATNKDEAKPVRKRRPPAVPWKKPKDMPRRPLSAYNLFFKAEREKLLAIIKDAKNGGAAAKAVSEDDKESGAVPGDSASPAQGVEKASSSKSKTGLGFANLAKTIAAKWKHLEALEREPFEKRAAVDKHRYDEAIAEWRKSRKIQQQQAREDKRVAAGFVAAAVASTLVPVSSTMSMQASAYACGQDNNMYDPMSSHNNESFSDNWMGNAMHQQGLQASMDMEENDYNCQQENDQVSMMQAQMRLLQQQQQRTHHQIQRANTLPTFSTMSDMAPPSNMNNGVGSVSSQNHLSLLLRGESGMTESQQQQLQNNGGFSSLTHCRSEPVMVGGNNKMSGNGFQSFQFPTGDGGHNMNFGNFSASMLQQQNNEEGINVEATLQSSWLTNLLQRQENPNATQQVQENNNIMYNADSGNVPNAAVSMNPASLALAQFQQQYSNLHLQQQKQQQQPQMFLNNNNDDVNAATLRRLATSASASSLQGQQQQQQFQQQQTPSGQPNLQYQESTMSELGFSSEVGARGPGFPNQLFDGSNNNNNLLLQQLQQSSGFATDKQSSSAMMAQMQMQMMQMQMMQMQQMQNGNGNQVNLFGMLSEQLDEDSIAFLTNLPFSRNQLNQQNAFNQHQMT